MLQASSSTESTTMQTDLHLFLQRLAGVVAATLVPVVLVAFLTVPFSLGRHPGEASVTAHALPRHMT
jgi:hypothetical protein